MLEVPGRAVAHLCVDAAVPYRRHASGAIYEPAGKSERVASRDRSQNVDGGRVRGAMGGEDGSKGWEDREEGGGGRGQGGGGVVPVTRDPGAGQRTGWLAWLYEPEYMTVESRQRSHRG